MSTEGVMRHRPVSPAQSQECCVSMSLVSGVRLYIYFFVESLEKVGLKVVILSRFYPVPGSSASGAWRVSVGCGDGGHQPHLM